MERLVGDVRCSGPARPLRSTAPHNTLNTLQPCPPTPSVTPRPHCLLQVDGAKAFKGTLESFLQKLTGEGGLGYQLDAIDMFYDECVEPLDKIIAGNYSSEMLAAAFREYSSSNAMVFFSRLVCSCYLQNEEEQFAPFLMAEGLSVKDFVQREVSTPHP